MTVAAALLALALVELDRRLLADGDVAGLYFAFGGGVQGARGVLTTIAGSLITVTATVFSITIVALQLASSQFTPRILRSFSRDRSNQVVLGVFIGTFTYALLVLRTVRSAADEGQTFVPAVSVAVAIGLALVAIGFLIYFIHHVAESIRAAVIVDRATADTLRLVEQLFPAPIGASADGAEILPEPDGERRVVAAESAGYLQAVDADSLFTLAETSHLLVRMELRIGEFVLPGGPLATVWPASAVDDEITDGVRGAFVTSPERTLQHDAELGIRQIADIAMRALSPGVNDPTTAVNCVDRLSEILVVLGNRRAPDRARAGEDGCVHLLAGGTTFERAVDLSFDQIRHYGAGDPSFAAHLLVTLGDLASLVPPYRRPVVVRQAEALLRGAREQTREPKDLALLEWAAAHGTRRRDGRS